MGKKGKSSVSRFQPNSNANTFKGNSGTAFQGNRAFDDLNLTSLGEQTTGQLNLIKGATIEAYTDIYSKLVALHQDEFLTPIGIAERNHYDDLLSTTKPNSIYKKYDSFYNELEKRHKSYMDSIKMPDINQLNPETQPTNNMLGFATEVTLVSIKNTLDKIQENLKYSEGGSGGGNSGEAKNTSDMLRGLKKDNDKLTKEQREQSRAYQTVATNVLNIYSSLSRNMVQGKTNSQLLSGISNTLGKWVSGGPWAALLTLATEIANNITQFFGTAISEHWSTMEEQFANYGIYTKRWNDQYAGYTQDIISKQDELYALQLQDNIKSTDWLKKQVELTSKGMETSVANDAALQDLILNKIAPNLDTSSNIFLDFQQRGLRDITESLGGLVESVRNISGTSRVAQASMGTIIEKLGPVELYTKKNLMTAKESAFLSALESAGMSTEDAVSLVSTISGVIAHPGQTLTSGSTLERLLAIELQNLPEGADAFSSLGMKALEYGSIFTGAIPNKGTYQGAMLQDIVANTVGLNYLNAYANNPEMEDKVKDAFKSAIETAEEPKDAYHTLYRIFESGFFQTADQKLEIVANNSEMVAGANGLLHQIAEWTLGIYEEIVKVTDKLYGRSDADIDARKTYNAIMSDTSLSELEKTQKLQEYLGSHSGYSNEMANKFIDAMYTNDTAQTYTSDYLQILQQHDKAGYERAKANMVAYETQKWKDLASQTSNLSNVLDYAEDTKHNLHLQAFDPNATRTEIYNDSALTDFLEFSAANLLAPGVGTAIVGGTNIKNQIQLLTGSKSSTKNGGLISRILGFADGGYVDKPTLSVVGEGNSPELITPIPQLVSAVSSGINSSNKFNPDYSELKMVINNVGSAIVQAIKEQNTTSGNFDTSTGLMNRPITNYASLQPIMKREG